MNSVNNGDDLGQKRLRFKDSEQKVPTMKAHYISSLFAELAVFTLLLPIGAVAWTINAAAEFGGAFGPKLPEPPPRRQTWTHRTVTGPFTTATHPRASSV